ncbi:PREDICTED: uncharacterized protein LOC109184097 [Ipomoea nil]|uniref:uncharacterized protein LOC109184097 n=1 Tax=Ipomoea nil TaxID=35883 RepID=UPI000901DE89|nr:PREDICTED: uncharacterized protein LOC109184097 [Ipomoea nil]
MKLNCDATLISKVRESLMRVNQDLSSGDEVTTPIKEKSKDDGEIDADEVEPLKRSVKRSLNDHCKVLKLTKNLRLNTVIGTVEQQESKQFGDWIASIGDGKIGGPNDGYAEVEIPNHMLLSSDGDHIETIVRSTFPMFANGNSDASYLQGLAILAPTFNVVNSVNEYMSELHTAESRTYFSCDTVCKADADAGILGDVHTPKFLNVIRASGVPNHSLTLNIGSPVMLLRNVDHSVGLCNGTQLVISKLADRVIEAELMDGGNKGTKVLIPKMSMSPSDTRLPFKLHGVFGIRHGIERE